MTRYVLAKVGRAVFVIWAAYTLSFILLYLLPGNAIDMLFNPTEQNAETAQAKAAIAAHYGFDKPPVVQYLTRLWAALHGDLGSSVQSGKQVWDAIGDVIGSTLVLTLLAGVLATAIAFTIAFTAAHTQFRWLRTLLQSVPVAAVSIPVFFVGLVAIQIFAFKAHWFPPIGDQGWHTLVLPVVTLAIPVSGPIAQLLLNSFLRELESPYVTTAIAKGGTRSWVLTREVFRNASLPALTIAGVIMGNLLAGAVIVETVFSRSGMGRLTQLSVGTRDITVIQGIVVTTALIFALINLIVDLLYPLLDPRLKVR
ncbi:MAG: ABC transporter permease [Gordonia sp. (in: high G+C Gram-positive bacteria)]